MENDFLIVDNHILKNGDITTEFRECDGTILVRHFSGVNSENFLIKKADGKCMGFAFIKINGVQYVNLNGHHMIDYRKFIHIQSVSNEGENVRMKNFFIGDVLLLNCDVEIFQKALEIMARWMKNNVKWLNDIVYYIFH